jgi:hypothetical protein
LFVTTRLYALGSELKPLLGILREKFPKKVLGTVGPDLGRLVKTFANGHLVQVATTLRS